MKHRMFATLTALALSSGIGLASAQTTTTTTWTDQQGQVIRQYSTTQNYPSTSLPSFTAQVGVEVPGTVTIHPLPPTITVPNSDQYSYTIINNRPIVVERTTRRVVHTW